MQLLINSCVKCQGALLPEADELYCLMCGLRYYPRREIPPWEPEYRSVGPTITSLKPDWWIRNAEIIRRLGEGERPFAIAQAVGCSDSHVRHVAQTLRDQRGFEGLMYTQRQRKTLKDKANANLIIAHEQLIEQKWWTRHAETIRLLDAGYTVKAISQAVGRTKRDIRQIRAELRDMRMESG